MASIDKFLSLKKKPDEVARMFLVALAVISLFSLMAINFIDPVFVVAADLTLIAILFFFQFPLIGLYVMGFFYPYWGWQLIWGPIDVPYIDLVSLGLFSAMCLRTVIYYLNKKTDKNHQPDDLILSKFPGLIFFLLFFAASTVSLINNEVFLSGFKFLLRPIAFLYLMYILLPVNLIKTKKTLIRFMNIMLVGGILTSALGLLSVFLGTGSWFSRRAVPFSVFGFNPLGGNHNAVAEILIITIPIALILYFLSTKVRVKNIYFLISFLATIVLVLTFSRSGWLVLALYFIGYYLFQPQHGRQKFDYQKLLILFLLFAVALTFYFMVWSQVAEVRGSTSSRWLMTSVSWFYLLENPIIGNGLNTFNSILGNTFVYWVEFADPLDSHGFIQKIILESGLLGLITFVSLLFYYFYSFLKIFKKLKTDQEKRLALLIIILFVGTIFFQLFSTSYFIVKMWLPIGLSVATMELIKNKEIEK